jgi:serine/threonine-protein kinase RsbW
MSDRPLEAASSSRPPRVLSLTLSNERRELARLGERVEQFGIESGLPPDDTAAVNLALDELVTNVIKYAYDDDREHGIHVTVTLRADLVTITVEDEGKPFNPLEAPSPNLDLPIEDWPIGGLGVHIVKSIADTLDYRRERGRNVVRVEKRLIGHARKGDGAGSPPNGECGDNGYAHNGETESTKTKRREQAGVQCIRF